MGLREAGMNAGGCNVKIRSINAFLTWCFENEYNPDNLRIKKLKSDQVVIKTFTDSHIKAFVNFKPKTVYDWRMYALVCLLIDTGCRIDELLSINHAEADLEQLYITVRGKGSKERIVPISIEMRKILYQYSVKKRFKKGNLLFPTKTGTKMNYHNLLRDFKMHCENLWIENVQCRTFPRYCQRIQFCSELNFYSPLFIHLPCE